MTKTPRSKRPTCLAGLPTAAETEVIRKLQLARELAAALASIGVLVSKPIRGSPAMSGLDANTSLERCR